MDNVITVRRDGIEAEIPAEIALIIDDMDRSTFSVAYLSIDQFHEQISTGKENEEYMKNQLDKFFEIQKRKRNIQQIGGNI